MKIKQELQSKFVFTVDYRKRSNHGVPDILSRNPVNDEDKYGYKHIDFRTNFGNNKHFGN